MNYVTYGQQRDEQIVKLIFNGRAFTRAQIQQIFFAKQKDGKRKAQLRLQKITEAKQVKKWVRKENEPTIYYHTKPRNIDHALLINDVYCSMLTQKPTWYTLDFRWSYSILGGIVIADALAIIHTQPDRKGKRVVFIEVERNPRKRFDKDTQYKKVFNADWQSEEWAVIEGNKLIFPSILLVTDEPIAINSPLRFLVVTPEQVRRDVYSLIRR